MTNTQRLQIQMSEKRERLNELLSRDGLSDEERAEETALAVEYKDLEQRFRIALEAEGEEAAVGVAEPETEPELRDIRARASVNDFIQEAITGRATTGASHEFRQALGLADGAFPLELLDDVQERSTTNVDASANQATWLDRMFSDTAAQRLGVTFRSVPAGVAALPITTAGAAPGQKGRAQAVTADSYTVAVTELKPTRASAVLQFSIEDAARLPGLEAALTRDLRNAMTERVDRTIFLGDTGANENAGDITGLSGASITEKTLKQADKTVGPKTVAAFASMLDGVHATTPADLNIVASAGAAQLWMSTNVTSGNSQTPYLLSRFMTDAGLSWSVRGGISTTTADKQFGAFVGRRRGIAGAAVAAVWSQARLTRDPYSESDSGEVRLVLHYLWNFGIIRAASFQRLKFVA